jgi:uncharacterized membrane protein YcaP (DUF421 family)
MDTVWRVVVIYAFLIIALRTMGKRDIGQLAPFDLVILLLIPELVSQAMVGEDFSLINGIVGVTTLLSLVFLTSVAAFLNKGAARIIEGQPSILVQHGRLVPENMNRERVAPEEVVAQMRQAGLDRMAQVKWGILETDGKISFVSWEPGGAPRKESSERPL